jgi:hypothetical protein
MQRTDGSTLQWKPQRTSRTSLPVWLARMVIPQCLTLRAKASVEMASDTTAAAIAKAMRVFFRFDIPVASPLLVSSLRGERGRAEEGAASTE